MRSFPITNGVQSTNAYSQIHYIHTLLNRNVKHTGRPNVKIGVSIQANFSKTTERKETPLTGIQVRLKLSLNQETDQKSVHSTTSYFNIKVPYQMTKMIYGVKGVTCRFKIEHLLVWLFYIHEKVFSISDSLLLNITEKVLLHSLKVFR